MKQYITEKQFYGLSEKAKDKLEKWYLKDVPVGTTYTRMPPPLLSIGQMIEFLDIVEVRGVLLIESRGDAGHIVLLLDQDEWCDALWDEVKTMLER